jgi:hypothetical protein
LVNKNCDGWGEFMDMEVNPMKILIQGGTGVLKDPYIEEINGAALMRIIYG